MSAKKSDRQNRSTTKGKATAKQNASERMSTRGGRGASRAKAGLSENNRSRGRFPGEVPLTGEDRPAHARGGKKDKGGHEFKRAAGSGR